MKKLLLFLCAISAPMASQAIVLPTGPFPTLAFLTENFDAIPTGGYTTHPVFSGFGNINMIGTGGLITVAPNPVPALSAPQTMYGRGVDVEWTVPIGMRRFGGFFRRVNVGLVITTATFTFFDALNNNIGSVTVPLTNAWTWRGFVTIPKWRRVEVTGNAAVGGLVAHDNVRIRWF